MKLDNRGWGIREMLVLSGILVFFFGIALYFIHTLYSSLSFEINDDNNLYKSLENTIEQATINYIDDNYVNNETKIDLNLLIENDYLSEIIDPETEEACKGYALVEDYDQKEVEAYIKCDNYVSINY